MACEKCKRPMHDQYQGYKGRWYCFHPGENHGRVICETPVEEWGDFKANDRRLLEAKTPKWCPKKDEEEE